VATRVQDVLRADEDHSARHGGAPILSSALAGGVRWRSRVPLVASDLPTLSGPQRSCRSMRYRLSVGLVQNLRSMRLNPDGPMVLLGLSVTSGSNGVVGPVGRLRTLMCCGVVCCRTRRSIEDARVWRRCVISWVPEVWRVLLFLAGNSAVVGTGR
jgi:hypothetical protein